MEPFPERLRVGQLFQAPPVLWVSGCIEMGADSCEIKRRGMRVGPFIAVDDILSSRGLAHGESLPDPAC